MGAKLIIPHLGILVTTYCNLNCRDCADLIPKRERRHYKPEDIKEDLEKVLQAVEYIEEVLVIGGEVLLYPWLEEIIDFLGEREKIGKIIITTNCAMKPEEKLLACLKRNKVLVRCSGYLEHVTPDRQEVVQRYKDSALELEDLKNMTWLSMGNAHKRERTVKELQKVFKTCSMRDCVTLTWGGKIFYCSRQLSASEIELYPDPEEYEYVDVRNTKNLKEAFRKFYELSYISTCNYCDGISCVTSRIVPTATQILNKLVFLEMLNAYEILKGDFAAADKESAVLSVYQTLEKNEDRFIGAEGVRELLAECTKIKETSEIRIRVFTEILKKLLNFLTDDYNYVTSSKVPYAKTEHIENRPNVIKIGMYPADPSADILLTEESIIQAMNEKYPIDYIAYNRLFIESRLDRLKTEKITCVVSGLSYTQYGIIEKNMPVSTVNLSITSEDTPYSVLFAEYALKINPDVNVIVLPITYYQGCYDMSDDEFILHKEVVTRINIPILGEPRNYKGSLPGLYQEGNSLKIYEAAINLDEVRVLRDEQIKTDLVHEEFFNKMNPQSIYGGLHFDFRKLATREEKFASAKITAEHNERVCSEKGYQEVKKYLAPFLEAMKEAGKRVLIFVPPMTEYLYASYHKELREFYYDKVAAIWKQYNNVTFVDLADDKRFLEDDFSDFEHLNESGGKKLTAILGEMLVQYPYAE